MAIRGALLLSSSLLFLSAAPAKAMGDVHGFKGLKLERSSVKTTLSFKALGLKIPFLAEQKFALTYNSEDISQTNPSSTRLDLSFRPDFKFQPFISAGFGGTRYWSGLSFSQDKYEGEQQFSLGTGLRYQFSDSFAIDGSYNFVDAQDLGFIDEDYNDHRFRLGFTWSLN